MGRRWSWQSGLILALLTTPPAGAGPAEPAASTLAGKVLLLSDALKADGQVADPDPIARQVVLRQPDGTLAPLLSDEASRALFLDARLRDRPARLQVRRHPQHPYLQVVTFQVEHAGAFQVPEYYCDVCTISVRYPQPCPCCQGPLELRMKPDPR